MVGALLMVAALPTASRAGASPSATEAMPNLVGLSRAAAWQSLRDHQLFFATRGPGANSTAWQRVTGEIPAAGTPVPVRSTVILLVTTAPAPPPVRRPVPRPSHRHVAVHLRVPGVRGQSLQYANWRERQAGFRVRSARLPSRRGGFSRVIRQVPTPGTLARRGVTVVLYYQTSPRPFPHQLRIPRPTHVVPVARAGRVKVGLATWYYDKPGVCATWYLPHGTRLYVQSLTTHVTISCLDTNTEGARGIYAVDLNPQQFAQLAPLGTGVISVRVWW